MESELPSSKKLIKSTISAAVVAGILLITTVLPAEYGIDPTGFGKVIGLKKMGEIKIQLADEAATENEKQAGMLSEKSSEESLQRIEQKIDDIALVLADVSSTDQNHQDITVYPKKTGADQVAASVKKATPVWKDEVSITIEPGQGVEYKLVMDKGSKAWFEWTANGSKLNFDAHGNGSGRSIQYKKGRGVPEDDGMLEAAFKGDHGWFWRNRTNEKVTLTLKTKGDYIKLKRTA
jgi:hypothetical protein